MQLLKVNIKNFRNIESAEYELDKVNVFTGPNAKGKTNTILAIYWALTDYLMDGTSEYPTFKPHEDTSRLVSVELIFDTFSFKKTYQEKWVKTRGSSETRLEGHTTEYFIDDVKYPVTEGKRLLIENLGLDDVKVSSKLDIVRAIIDPYYLADQLEWKELRVFIIDLVGDVDDQMVLDSNQAFVMIADDLNKQKYNTSALTKLYKQVIKKNNDELKENENYITAYKKVEDVDSDALNKAQINIELLDDEIARLRSGKVTDSNPNIRILEDSISKTRIEYADSRDADRKLMDDKNSEIKNQLSVFARNRTKATEEINRLKNEETQSKFELKSHQMKLDDVKNQIELKNKERDRLIAQWEEVEDTEYLQSITSNACPHCGGILNEEELETHRKLWEEEREARLDNIVAEGSAVKNQIENLEFELKDLRNKKLDNKDFTQAINFEESRLAEITKKESELEGQLITDYESEETAALKAKGLKLSEDLEKEKAIQAPNDYEEQIAAKTKEKARHQEVIDEHNAYLITQKRISETEKVIEKLHSGLIDNETKLMLLEDFIKTKLEMLKSNVESVFGEVEFVLIDANIKEGSYNEVCYPLILGQKTPFKSGSGAEKIITGVNIIESVKSKLGLKDVPVIFDEADKLDTNTLKTKVKTGSQIISTRVDDVNYSKVELVKS